MVLITIKKATKIYLNEVGKNHLKNQLSTFSFFMDNLHYVVIFDYNNRKKVDV